MSEREQHCPFLNRADPRCSQSFSLNGLGHALDHCFGQYHQCPTYIELLAERRVRRGGQQASTIASTQSSHTASHAQAPLIPLQIAGRYQKPTARP